MSDPLKVGMIGTGHISDRHMTAYVEHPDRVRLTAVCDIDEPLAREYAKKTGAESVYTDYEDMLRNADIEAVDICTGPHLHSMFAIAAANAGKHVLTEKPMAHNLQACRDMIEAAEKAGVTLMVAQQLRFSADAAAVKKLIDDGTLGDILAARTHLFMGTGPRAKRPRDSAQGGGILLTNSIHHIDLLRHYLGNIKRVSAVCRSGQTHMENVAEDLVSANIEFENGAIGDVFAGCTYVFPDRCFYMVLGSEGTIHSTPSLVMGGPDESPYPHFGTIMYSPREQLDLQKESDRQKIVYPPFEPIDSSGTNLSTNYFVNEILHFEECCRTGKEPITSGRDNIESMKVVFGFLESSRTGMSVDLDDL
jgi:predicted dehydrogenase